MKKIIIAFDIDGTLRANREERHREEVEANPRMVDMLKGLAHSKNVEIHLWSNRGAEYCQEMRVALGLEKHVKESNCHKKQWLNDQQVRVKSTVGDYPAILAEAFRPDIAFDDQQAFDGAELNIIVREK